MQIIIAVISDKAVCLEKCDCKYRMMHIHKRSLHHVMQNVVITDSHLYKRFTENVHVFVIHIMNNAI
jgi:hypothetical protein